VPELATQSPRYIEAINDALRSEMSADERVILLGVDVGASGGVYGVTRGLYDEFGSRRVIDTPIAEAGVLGASVGAAMAGLRPVVEIMYMDFLSVCLDPVINQAAKLRYMTGGGVTVPVVFRTQTGGGRSAGAQHSQSLEALLAHIPGMCVYCPSDARDAHDLLIEAIRLEAPVCFVENRRLYGKRTDEWERAPLPAGRARVVTPGDHVTVMTWGRMVGETRLALEQVGHEVSVELIDVRTLVPLDVDTLLASVERTGRCLIVHEAVVSYGPGAELLAKVAEDVLFSLDGPVRRYGALPTPIPYSPGLEAAVLPEAAGIAEAIRRIARE
jgi:pyruvate/2-oxoglutarate/acetoin dehydrogenase E1 component